jgi:hypothetical protein
MRVARDHTALKSPTTNLMVLAVEEVISRMCRSGLRQRGVGEQAASTAAQRIVIRREYAFLGRLAASSSRPFLKVSGRFLLPVPGLGRQ